MNNKNLLLMGVLMLSTIALSGCNGISGSNIFSSFFTTSTTINGTVYDPTRTFELVKFCSTASFDTNPDPGLLNCPVGNITDTFYNNKTGNWSCMACSFDATKCSTTTVTNITIYSGLNLSAEHIISSDFNGMFTVMCCNNMGSMCYRPLLIGNGTYQACGAGYNELIGSLSYNNVSNNWSVTSCLNGFK